jgi:hypothetical protein
VKNDGSDGPVLAPVEESAELEEVEVKNSRVKTVSNRDIQGIASSAISGAKTGAVICLRVGGNLS